jgi:spermidine/putrescine transport system permease protein
MNAASTSSSALPTASANSRIRPRLWPVLLIAGPGIGWIAFFLLIPFVAIAIISCLSRGAFGEITRPLTTENYVRFFGFGLLGFDPLFPMIFLRSLIMGTATAVLCVVLGFPLAFFIAGLPARYKTLALTLVVIPLWINLLIRTYAWQILLAHDGWLARLLGYLGILPEGAALYPGLFAVYVGMVCDFLPFLVLPLYASAEKLDWSIVEAAMDLGAGGWQVLRHAILPQVMPGLMAGVLLVFIPAMGQFVVPDLLGGAKVMLLGNAIQLEFGSSQDWPFGSAITVLAMVWVMLGLWYYARSVGRTGEPNLI